MKRLLWWLAALVMLVVPERCILAQQGHPMVMNRAATPNDEKLDPSIGWISEYQQPFIYQIWWAEIAECEGLPLDTERARHVQFFQVNAPEFIPPDVPAVVYAITYGEVYEGQIYVAFPYIWNKQLVSHEMLHELRLLAGDPNWADHDPRFYGQCHQKVSGEPEPNT